MRNFVCGVNVAIKNRSQALCVCYFDILFPESMSSYPLEILNSSIVIIQALGCPSCFVVTVMNTDVMEERKGFLLPYNSQATVRSSKGVRAAAQFEKTEAGIEAETVEDHRRLACFPWLVQLPFLRSRDPPV